MRGQKTGGRTKGVPNRAARDAEKAQAEQAALTHLLARRFVEASQCVIDFESKQVVQRGVGIDWKKVDPAGYAATLKAICGGRPKILARVSDVEIGVLAIGAAMMELWRPDTRFSPGWR